MLGVMSLLASFLTFTNADVPPLDTPKARSLTEALPVPDV